MQKKFTGITAFRETKKRVLAIAKERRWGVAVTLDEIVKSYEASTINRSRDGSEVQYTTAK